MRQLAFGLGVNDQGEAQTVQRIAAHDGSVSQSFPCVLVEAFAAVAENGVDGRLFAVPVSLTAKTYDAADKDQTDLNTIHGALQLLADTANGSSLAKLNALLAPVTIHGVDKVGDSPVVNGSEQSMSVDLMCHVYTTLAAPTTTTTTTTS